MKPRILNLGEEAAMFEFIVYSVPGSPFGRAVLATLEEKAASYRLLPVVPGTFRSPEHLARHPFGRVPVLEHDGFSLYESQAILRYLDRDLIAANPKPFFGYSDNTVLLTYLWNCGIVGYHGASVMVQLGRPGAMHPSTERSVRAALFTTGEFELTEPDAATDVDRPWSDPAAFESEPTLEACERWTWHAADRFVDGPAWGGDLEVLSWLAMADAEIGPDTQWLPYELPCKPGDPARRPCVISPYHYRLDWQMWFAAMSIVGREPWVVHLVAKLLRGDRDVKAHRVVTGEDGTPILQLEGYRNIIVSETPVTAIQQ
jgi:hypothetical protein